MNQWMEWDGMEWNGPKWSWNGHVLKFRAVIMTGSRVPIPPRWFSTSTPCFSRWRFFSVSGQNGRADGSAVVKIVVGMCSISSLWWWPGLRPAWAGLGWVPWVVWSVAESCVTCDPRKIESLRHHDENEPLLAPQHLVIPFRPQISQKLWFWDSSLIYQSMLWGPWGSYEML